MANSVLTTTAVTTLDRAALLRRLDLPTDMPIIGDIEDTSPINLDAGPSLKVHRDDAPWLNFGTTFDRCSIWGEDVAV